MAPPPPSVGGYGGMYMANDRKSSVKIVENFSHASWIELGPSGYQQQQQQQAPPPPSLMESKPPVHHPSYPAGPPPPAGPPHPSSAVAGPPHPSAGTPYMNGGSPLPSNAPPPPPPSQRKYELSAHMHSS